MFNFVVKRLWFFLISGILILISVVALGVFGLKPGIDFGSGSITTLSFEQEVDQNELEQELAILDYTGDVERNPQGDFLIRTVELTINEKAKLKESLMARFGTITEKGFENVAPVIARETARIAAVAVAVAAVGILLYVTWAFRRMPSPLHYGTCAIIALLHDALVTLGTFAIIGELWQWEINLMFVIGMLAVIGYSVNNTVVVFDRIRENLQLEVSPSFEVVVNHSVVESLGRSLNTSLTTLFVVLALLLFVGPSIRNFAAVLLVGIIAGTFSSLFIAPLLLVAWEKRKGGRFLRWLPLPAIKAKGG